VRRPPATLGAISLDVVRAAGMILLATLLQVTIVPDLVLLGGRPDVVVLVVVSLALLRGPGAGAIAGFCAGLFVDALGLGVIGASSLVLVVVGWRVGLYGERGKETAPVRPLIAVCVATLAAEWASLLIAALIDVGPGLAGRLVVAVIPTAMLNVLLAIGLYPLIRSAMRRPAANVVESSELAVPV
jgi:rod shape-determining protein MreD